MKPSAKLISSKVTVDYTREEEINVQPSMEKLLQEINDNLRSIQGLLEYLVERKGNDYSEY